MRVHAIRTGWWRCTAARSRERARGSGGARPPCSIASWSGRLPILAWAIEHPGGVVVVDTGESARVREPGYLPRWHPYYRTAVRFDVRPEDEIGPQLQLLDIDPGDVRTVVLTHLHTDHAGGLSHFPRARSLVAAEELAAASGLRGRLGRLSPPQNWPGWFAPTALDLQRGRHGQALRGRRGASPTGSGSSPRPATRPGTSPSSSRTTRRSSSREMRPTGSIR